MVWLDRLSIWAPTVTLICLIGLLRHLFSLTQPWQHLSLRPELRAILKQHAMQCQLYQHLNCKSDQLLLIWTILNCRCTGYVMFNVDSSPVDEVDQAEPAALTQWWFIVFTLNAADIVQYCNAQSSMTGMKHIVQMAVLEWVFTKCFDHAHHAQTPCSDSYLE